MPGSRSTPPTTIWPASFATWSRPCRPSGHAPAARPTDLFGPGVSPSIDLVGATLLDEIAASDDPFVLVLDDYHVIGADPIHRLVRFLIERGPPFAHLVLLTREDPPLPLARLRAHGRLVELRADDLRYTESEASAYLAESQPADLDPEQVARLLERTEGWIAGLQLAAISLRDRADAGALIESFGGSQRFVFDYLADEVLGRVDEDLRSFLVTTAVPERFTVGLCRALTGRDDAEALLDRAERANLFLVRLDAEGRLVSLSPSLRRLPPFPARRRRATSAARARRRLVRACRSRVGGDRQRPGRRLG